MSLSGDSLSGLQDGSVSLATKPDDLSLILEIHAVERLVRFSVLKSGMRNHFHRDPTTTSQILLILPSATEGTQDKGIWSSSGVEIKTFSL